MASCLGAREKRGKKKKKEVINERERDGPLSDLARNRAHIKGLFWPDGGERGGVCGISRGDWEDRFHWAGGVEDQVVDGPKEKSGTPYHKKPPVTRNTITNTAGGPSCRNQKGEGRDTVSGQKRGE